MAAPLSNAVPRRRSVLLEFTRCESSRTVAKEGSGIDTLGSLTSFAD
jgi:hypothetical protein